MSGVHIVHGKILLASMDPDRAYIMHARVDESTEHNRLNVLGGIGSHTSGSLVLSMSKLSTAVQ